MTAALLRDPIALGAPLRLGPGKKAKPLHLAFGGELSVEELIAAQSSELVQTFQAPAKLRERHHMLARVLAQGTSNVEAAAITGYDPQYIACLKSDPAFQELQAYYTAMEAEQYSVARADLHSKLAALGHDSLAELHDRLEAEPEKFTNKELLAVVEATADRTGFGKASQVNHTHEHSLSADTIAKIKRESGSSAPASEEDRAYLLRLAARGTAESPPEAEEAHWVPSPGGGLREEDDPQAAEDVASGRGELS